MPDLPQTSHIRLDLRGPVLHLWLNRPEVRNALSQQMLTEILATFAAIADDRAVRVVVLRGSGGTFCAGADIKNLRPPARRRRRARPTRSRKTTGASAP